MSRLERPLRSPDWSDTHHAPVRDDLVTARAAYEVALGTMPGWVRGAMAVRNGIVGLFGLVAPTMGRGMLDLPVVHERPESYELGLVDRHLTFTLETERGADAVSLTTRIWFNNWTGRLYLAVVVIPHKIIVRQALWRLS